MHRARRGVERGGDVIIRPVLPILRPRCSVGQPSLAWCRRERERREDRCIGGLCLGGVGSDGGESGQGERRDRGSSGCHECDWDGRLVRKYPEN